ncbi:MAG: exodeoxyribonuclease VII large subunit [Clostridia bacterium]|nr:exodeoxyribonuclease VII large subunit [Clostridia bacterium]
MNDAHGQLTLTVSQLNDYVTRLLDTDELLRSVYVRGEISNFKYYSSGHLYFSLKDSDGVVSSVMFRSYAQRLTFSLKDGMKVVARGRVSLYGKSGQYQLYVDDIIPDGVGALHLAYEQLKQRLYASGYFDQAHKKALPKYPGRIGIVTSPSGAAVRDMINVLGRRFPLAEIVIYPSQVQGNGAAKQISDGISYFNDTQSVDVIIIGRGGGSIEDLWEFNSEYLAKTIYSCTIPIISAVGHETDFTISDFVSDVRAPTPSAAAELAVPDFREIQAQLDSLKIGMRSTLQRHFDLLRSKIKLLSEGRGMNLLVHSMNARRITIDNFSARLGNAIASTLDRKRISLKASVDKLNALNPLSVMSRGFATVTDKKSGDRIMSATALQKGALINVTFKDGNIGAIVVSEYQPDNE